MAATPASLRQRRPAARLQAGLCLPFSAFDVVLFLDEKLNIARSEGRPQCLGWRKASLLGQPAAQFLPAEEQAVLRRMVTKLASTGAQICKDTIAVWDGAGCSKPCHAILGHSGRANARYFLALLALKLPRRLKKLQHQPVSAADITQLAA
jgi:hypothetical protein